MMNREDIYKCFSLRGELYDTSLKWFKKYIGTNYPKVGYELKEPVLLDGGMIGLKATLFDGSGTPKDVAYSINIKELEDL